MWENLINLNTDSITNTWTSLFGWMWSAVKNWDFSLFKYLFIWILILIPLVLLYLIISWRLSLFNMWFWEWYWLRLITWEFGSWKTKNVFQSAFLWKKENPHWVLISNLDYDFVDFHFDSKLDFDFILRDLVQYIRDTNNVEDLKKSIEFPPIKIIVDEAHLYLFARDFKWFTKDILLVLTQCRKRDISVDFITQELWQIDVFIRRLCPYIEYFQKLPLGFSKQSMFYSLDVEWTSMHNEEMFEEVESSYLLPFSRWPIFNKKIKEYYAQKYLTKYVIWWSNVWYSWEDKDSVVSNKYEEFKSFMLKNLEEFRKPKERKKTIFDKLLSKWFKSHKLSDVDEDIIKKQSEVIQSLLKYIPEDELVNYSEFLPSKEDNSKDTETL